MRTTRILALVAVAALGTALTACGDDKAGSEPAAGSEKIAVKAGDTTCEVATTSLPAGTHIFEVTNSGAKVTEFYVYTPDNRVVGEVENITPGLSRELRVELPAGTYQATCKPGMVGNGIRTALTVSGQGGALNQDAALAQATAGYSRYITEQAEVLVQKTAEFVAAIKAGDMAKAKALYPDARTPYERIEPVAEIFGDLDQKIDGREDGATAEIPFSGYHKLEKDLWERKAIDTDGPVADRLLADVKDVVAKAKAEKLSPLQVANGAKELLDEVASSKITGEEERYSHTDLWDFAANVEGVQAVVAVLRPVLEKRDPALVKQIDAATVSVRDELAKHKHGTNGWKLQTELSQAQLKSLSDVINALAEPISKIAGVVAAK